MWLTLKIGWIGIALAIVLGIICALVMHFKFPVITQIIKVYIEIFRNTPFINTAIFLLLWFAKARNYNYTETCGIIGLARYTESYMAESFRSGLDAVPKIQDEAT